MNKIHQKRKAAATIEKVVDIDDYCDSYDSSQTSSNIIVPDSNAAMPPSNLPLVPAMSNNILQPVVASKESIATKKCDDKSKTTTSNWAEFELDNSSPFELVELQSINDMDALATVLIPDSANVHPIQSSSNDNIPKISNNTTTSSQSDNHIWSSQFANNDIPDMNTSQYDDIVVLSVTEHINNTSTDTVSATNVTCNPGNLHNSYDHRANKISNIDDLYFETKSVTHTIADSNSDPVQLNNNRKHQMMTDNFHFTNTSNAGQDRSQNVQIGHLVNGSNVNTGVNLTHTNHPDILTFSVGHENHNLSGNHRPAQSYQTSGMGIQPSMELPPLNNRNNEHLHGFSDSSSNSTTTVDSNKVYPPKPRGTTLVEETGSGTTRIGQLSNHNMEPLRVIQQLLLMTTSSDDKTLF